MAVPLAGLEPVEPVINPASIGSDILQWGLPEGSTVLIPELEIRLRTAQLARQIAADFSGKPFVVVSILKGAFMFSADLLRRLSEYGLAPEIDFLRALSYGEADYSSGKVSLQLDVSIRLRDREVLLLDDIADTGLTLSFLIAHLKRKGAPSVKTCVLLDKPSRREVPYKPDYVGFEIPNRFVVGYGLDYAEKYRYLPFIATFDPPSA